MDDVNMRNAFVIIFNQAIVDEMNGCAGQEANSRHVNFLFHRRTIALKAKQKRNSLFSN